MPPSTAVATFELVISADAAEQSIFSASSGAAGSIARAQFSSDFRYALARHLHISEYRVLVTHVRAGSLVAGIKILDTPASTAALEPPAKDCEMTLASQIATSSDVLLDGSFTAVKLVGLYPPLPPAPSPSEPPLVPFQEQSHSMMPTIAGAAGGAGALIIGGLVAGILLLRWRKRQGGKKRTVSVVRNLPQVQKISPQETEPLSPKTRARARTSDCGCCNSDATAQAHATLDTMSGIAKIVAGAAAKAKGQKDIELARKAAHLNGCTAASPVSTTTSPPQSSILTAPPLPAVIEPALNVQETLLNIQHQPAPTVSRSAGPLPGPPVSMGLDEEAASSDAVPPPSPLQRAGSMFVEKVGWMSSKSAKKLGKKGLKGPEAEAMAAAMGYGRHGSVKGAVYSNKLASTAI